MMTLVVTLILGFLIGTTDQAEAFQSRGAAETYWKAFRQAYPYHVQGLAVSATNPDGTRFLIIAEPPPHVTFETLKTLEPDLLTDVRIGTNSVGYDGWVKDIVVELPALAPERFHALVDRLHVHLFSTAYKAHVIEMARDGAAARSGQLNLQVTAADLRKWMFEAREPFLSFYGGAPAPISEILARRRSGLYYSVKPGLVALVVPRAVPLGAMRRELRHFALDSDLILGATAGPTHVAIVARERTVDIQVLPPLRTETILLLAAARSKELAQSYERTNFFAGRIDQEDADWAPIYLSDVLIDTEYGSLLNITDQLLKSWSSDGQVRYVRFPYPDPPTWPFGKPLLLDAHLKEVTFNWNTKGAGYTADLGGSKLYALNRTGSLPISYIPGEVDPTGKNPLVSYEEKGYAWFSRLGDPNLVRVVQYAALYQIFQEYGIQDTAPSMPRNDHLEWEYLGRLGGSVVQLVLTMKGQEVDALPPALRKGLTEVRSKLQAAQARFGDEVLTSVGQRLANPRMDEDLIRELRSGSRQVTSLTKKEQADLTAGGLAYDLQHTEVGRAIGAMLGSTQTLYKRYAEAADSRMSGWIRTPSIVVSTTQKDLASYRGGHNLDSRISRYRTSETIAQGSVRVVEEGGSRVVLINPKDAPNVPSLLRATALAPRPEELPGVLSDILKKTALKPASNLPREQVLRLPPLKLGEPRGLRADAAGHARFVGGWQETAAGGGLTNPAGEFSRGGTRAITITKKDDFSFEVFLPGLERSRTAQSYDAAVDLITGAMRNVDGQAGPWALQMEGFSSAEARSLLRTTEVQFASKEQLDLTGFSRPRGVTSDRMLRAVSERYDFQRARIIETVSETVSDGPFQGMKAVRVSAEIPAIMTAKPPLLVRIRLIFRELVTEPMRQAVEAAVNKILRRTVTEAAAGEKTLAQTILRDLKRDLKQLKIPNAPHVDFEIEVRADFGDFYVADAYVPRRADGG